MSLLDAYLATHGPTAYQLGVARNAGAWQRPTAPIAIVSPPVAEPADRVRPNARRSALTHICPLAA